MVSMKALKSFLNKFEKSSLRRLPALLLAVLLVLNVLVTALPLGGFNGAQAEENVNRPCVIAAQVKSGTYLKLKLTLKSEPVLQDYPNPQKGVNDLSFWVADDGRLFDWNYDPYVAMSYTDGILELSVYSEYDSTIQILPKSDVEITALSLDGGNSANADCVSSLAVSGIGTLASLDVSGMKGLEKLALSKLPALTAINASGCSLDIVKIVDCPAIGSLDLSGNRLSYGSLPMPSDDYTSYNYASQSDMNIQTCAECGTEIDLSECGTAVYTWYFAEDDTPVTAGLTQSGKLGAAVVGDELVGKAIYCVIKNSDYPMLPQVKTTPVHVVENLQFVYSDCNSSVLKFTVSGSDAPAVYNDGTDISALLTTAAAGGKVEYTLDLSATDTPYSGSVYVTSASPVTDLSLRGKNVDSVSTDTCAALKTIEISGTRIGEIDLSKNTDLKSAVLSGNNLRSFKLPASLELLDISGNENLSSISALDTCKSTLKALYADNCAFTGLDLTGFTALTRLSAAYNEIEQIVLPENSYKSIDISHNELTFETLPSYPLGITDGEFVYSYDSQAALTVGRSYGVGDTVDISAQMKSSADGDTLTAYLRSGTDYMVSSADGTFTIPSELAGKSVYFTLESSSFNKLTMRSGSVDIAEAQATIVTVGAAVRFEKGGDVSFSVKSTAPVLVDWGDGVRHEYTPSDSDYSKPVKISGTAAEVSDAAVIYIYTTGDVTEADFSRLSDSDTVPVTAVNFSQWQALKALDLSGNSINTLNIVSDSDMTALDISDNAFTFNTLPDFNGESYVYSPQKNYTLPKTVNVGASVDLSAVGADTYSWYNATTNEAVTPKTSANGVFTFGSEHAGLSLYCKMQNEDYELLTIETDAITVKASNNSFSSATAAFKTKLASGTQVKLVLDCDDAVYVDWGDSALVAAAADSSGRLTAEGKLAGDTVKLYTGGKLTLISATDMGITEAELSSATALETLDLSGNSLESIDISKNTALTVLNLSDNAFIFPKLPTVSDSFESYIYSPQALFTIPEIKGTGAAMSVLTALTTDNAKMGYAWYAKSSTGDDELLVQGTDKDYIFLGNGKFSFNADVAGKTVYCIVSNSQYPDLGIKTTDMKILAGGGISLSDSTGMVKNMTIAEGSICKTTDGTTIPAGDLNGSASAANAVLTFMSKNFANTADITSDKLLTMVKSLLSTFNATDNCHNIYDFKFVDSTGAEVADFNGSVAITLNYPSAVASKYAEYDFYIFHYITSGSKKGTMEQIPVSADSDGLTFTATSFSPYILVYQADPEKDSEKNQNGGSNGTTSTPTTGDYSEYGVRAATVILVVSLAVMASSAAVIIAKKRARRKAN